MQTKSCQVLMSVVYGNHFRISNLASMVKFVCVITCIIVTSVKAQAAIVSLTGAELLNSGYASFPTTTPQLIGDSLYFPGGDIPNGKLVTYDLQQLGFEEGFPVPPQITVQMNLTRRSLDHDPHLMFTDGVLMAGGMFADDNGGEFIGGSYVDDGDRGSGRSLNLCFVNAGYPLIGESFNVSVTVKLNETPTHVIGSMNGFTGNYFTPDSRNLHDDRLYLLQFVFMRDNEPGEEYQINSIEFITPGPTVPEPSSIVIFSGCFGFLLLRNKHRLV